MAQKRITIPTQDDDPKRYVLALRQSSLGRHTPHTNREEGHHIEADRDRQDSECNLTQTKHRKCWRTVVRGRREEAARHSPHRSWQAQHVCPICKKHDRNREGVDDPWSYVDGCLENLRNYIPPIAQETSYLQRPLCTWDLEDIGSGRSINAMLDRFSLLIFKTRKLTLMNFDAAVKNNLRWCPRHKGQKIAVAPPPPIKFLDIGTKMGLYWDCTR